MPLITDVFNGDPFGVVGLSQAINNVPYEPRRIERMGLFQGDDGNGAGLPADADSRTARRAQEGLHRD